MINPHLQLATTYFLLRPFLSPVKVYPSLVTGEFTPEFTPEFLDAENWTLKSESGITGELQGANPGHAQELNQALHPHLDLRRTMVHVPTIRPGDLVVWHCDSELSTQ
jgi:hypothetical protein